MARIEKRKNKRGISYLTTVRRKGFETVARTFDTPMGQVKIHEGNPGGCSTQVGDQGHIARGRPANQ